MWEYSCLANADIERSGVGVGRRCAHGQCPPLGISASVHDVHVTIVKI
jgi:hypothetical protein